MDIQQLRFVSQGMPGPGRAADGQGAAFAEALAARSPAAAPPGRGAPPRGGGTATLSSAPPTLTAATGEGLEGLGHPPATVTPLAADGLPASLPTRPLAPSPEADGDRSSGLSSSPEGLPVSAEPRAVMERLALIQGAGLVPVEQQASAASPAAPGAALTAAAAVAAQSTAALAGAVPSRQPSATAAPGTVQATAQAGVIRPAAASTDGAATPNPLLDPAMRRNGQGSARPDAAPQAAPLQARRAGPTASAATSPIAPSPATPEATPERLDEGLRPTAPAFASGGITTGAGQPGPGQPGAATPSPLQATLYAAVDSPTWPRQLGQQLVRFARGGGEQRIELQLHPAELGPLSVTLRVGEQGAQAQFLSAHAQVRQALEQAIPQLREALAEQGIALGEASVGEQRQQGNADGGAGFAGGRDGGLGQDAGEELDSGSSVVATGSALEGRVDLYA